MEQKVQPQTEEKVQPPTKKRHRLTLAEQAARAKQKKLAADQRFREIKKKLKSKERKERTRYLVQLGAIIQKHLGEGDPVDLKQFAAFLNALNTPTDIRNLIQLGAIIQKHLGAPLDLKQFAAFLNALETPTDTAATRLIIAYDKNCQKPVIENGQKTDKVYTRILYPKLQDCYTGFLNGRWFDSSAHQNPNPKNGEKEQK